MWADVKEGENLFQNSEASCTAVKNTTEDEVIWKGGIMNSQSSFLVMFKSNNWGYILFLSPPSQTPPYLWL